MEKILHANNKASRPSKLNGENIAGAAFLFFSLLFMAAGQVNAVFAILYPADYLLVAIGIALVLLGYRTWRHEEAKALSKETLASANY